MVVWTGAGVLVLLIGIVSWVIGTAVGGDQYGIVGGGFGLMVGAAGIWFLGKRLNDPAKARILVDPQTGEPVLLQRTHTLFWVRMEIWAVILALGGIAYIIFSMVSGERHF